MKKLKSIFTFCLSLLPILGLLLVQTAAKPVAASAGQSTIAYVLPNDTTGDEIHLINPEGTNDHMIWHTGTSRVTTVPEVAQLAWKPDASELAFWSSFQAGCSAYDADIYAIRNDGSGFRRVTAPPACGTNPGLPTGTVQLQVANPNSSGTTFQMYIEGAPGPKSVTLGPGDSTTVVFTNVMDYGYGVPQWAVGIVGYNRFSSIDAHMDVIAGQTISAWITLNPMDRGWTYPTYDDTGTNIAYFLNPGIIYYAPSDNTNPGGVGWKVLADGVSLLMSPERLQWGRGTHANQFLYQAYDTNVWPFQEEIYLVDEGSDNPGTVEVATDVSLGLVWLPDGSGFLYSATQQDPETLQRYGNIFEFNFASQTSTQLSQFTTGYTRDLSISPDGQKVVFEYQADGDWSDAGQPIDLWMMNRDGSAAALFVKNAQSPAWSPSALPVYSYVYLPFLTK